MSVINQMLQSLQRRRAGQDDGGDGLPEGVRPVATAKTGRKIPLSMVLLVLIAASGGGAYWWWMQQTKSIKPVAVIGKVPPPPAPIVQRPAPVAPPEHELIAGIEEHAVSAVVTEEKPVSAGQGKPARKRVAAGKKADHATEAHDQPTAEPEKGIATARKAAEPVAHPKSHGEVAATGKSVKSVTPQHLSVFNHQKALQLLQQGRVSEARGALDEAVRLDPYNLVARQALAGLLVEQKQYGAAEQLLREGLDLNPEQYGFAMALARLQVERGDVNRAVESLQKTLPFAMDNAGYHAFLAALLQRQERHREAVEYYQAAGKLTTLSGQWLMGLGISLQAEKRFAEAHEVFSRAKQSGDLTPELLEFIEQRIRQAKLGMRLNP